MKHEPIEITRKQALAHTGRERWAGWYWSHSRVTPQTPDDVLLRVRPSQYPVRADARGPFPSRLKAEADIMDLLCLGIHTKTLKDRRCGCQKKVEDTQRLRVEC